METHYCLFTKAVSQEVPGSNFTSATNCLGGLRLAAVVSLPQLLCGDDNISLPEVVGRVASRMHAREAL